jgi:hypothetical protein
MCSTHHFHSQCLACQWLAVHGAHSVVSVALVSVPNECEARWVASYPDLHCLLHHNSEREAVSTENASHCIVDYLLHLSSVAQQAHCFQFWFAMVSFNFRVSRCKAHECAERADLAHLRFLDGRIVRTRHAALPQRCLHSSQRKL